MIVIAIIETGYHWLALLIGLFWFVRILSTSKVSVIVSSLLIGTVLMGRGVYQNNRISTLDPNQSQFLLLVKPTTYEIDGNVIKFQSLVKNSPAEEEITVSFYAESEEEKNRLTQVEMPLHFVAEGPLEKPNVNTNINQFDYRKYLERKNIYYELVPESIEVSTFSESLPISYKLDLFRYQVFQNIDRVLYGESKSYVMKLFFGKNKELDEVTLDSFRRLGLVHLISASGMHIHLIIQLLYEILLRIGVTRERSRYGMIGFLTSYGLLVGFRISIFRIIFQHIIKYTKQSMKLQSNTLDNWSQTLILALLIRPQGIAEIGFQLSFLISGTIIFISQTDSFKKIPTKRSRMLISFLIPLVSIPVISYHFFEIPWLSFLTNVLFTPFFLFVLFPLVSRAFVGAFILGKSNLFNLFIRLLNYVLRAVESFFSILGQFKPITLVTGRLSLWPMILLSIIIMLIVMLVQLKCTKERVKYYAILFILLYVILISKRFEPRHILYHIDVGQGEAIVIKPAFSKTGLLIDTGGTVDFMEKEEWEVRTSQYSIGKDTIAPVLKSMGISQLDHVLITHGDIDHMGELSEISNYITIKEITSNMTTFNSPAFQEELSEFTQKNVQVNVIEGFAEKMWNGLAFTFINSQPLTGDNNMDSLVFYSEIGGKSWLFTGDITKEVEKAIIEKHPKLTVDILNVAHHGSSTSTDEDFVEQLTPSLATISAGRNNMYGHPTEETLETLEDHNITIYRTDLHGGILYTSHLWHDTIDIETVVEGEVE